MDVLVDYYNIPEQERRKGVPYVVDRIMATMVPNHVDDRHRRVDIRLYGGWYEERSLTRDAQQIERALSAQYGFPWTHGSASHKADTSANQATCAYLGV